MDVIKKNQFTSVLWRRMETLCPVSTVSRAVRYIRRSGTCNGLTLIELMISLAILGTLAGIAAPIFGTYLDKARSAKSVSDIRTVLESGIRLYEFDTGALPEQINDVARGGILDPWGNTYKYLNLVAVGPAWESVARTDELGVTLNSDFDLYSTGKDGKTTQSLLASWSQDDVIRAGEGEYVGQASDVHKKPKKDKKPKKPKDPKPPKVK